MLQVADFTVTQGSSAALLVLKLGILFANTAIMYRAACQPNFEDSSESGHKHKPIPANRAESIFKGIFLRFIFIIPFGYLALTLLEALALVSVLLIPSRFSVVSDACLSLLSALSLRPTPTPISPSFFIGSLLTIIGCSGRIACYHALREHFTFELTELQDHKLITRGPYSVVRHPAYISGQIALVGAMITLLMPGSTGGSSWVYTGALRVANQGPTLAIFGSQAILDVLSMLKIVWIAYCIGFIVLLVPRTLLEDNFLKKRFGKSWQAYAQVTKYRLLPGIF